MRYMHFAGQDQESYEIAVLVPRLDEGKIRSFLLEAGNLNPESVIALTLHQEGKKTKAATMKEYLATLMPVLKDLKVKYLIVCDSGYFQTIARQQKTEAHLGYVLEADSDVNRKLGYKPFVVYAPNPDQVFYDPPKVTKKIQQGLDALNDHRNQTYQDPGTDIIHFAQYPSTEQSIQEWLQRLLDMDVDLTCDIEAFSLKHVDAGIGSIAFAWNKHEGIAFAVDYVSLGSKNDQEEYGYQLSNPRIKDMLKNFFMAFKKRIIFHNISYDAMVLIYELFMKDILDTEGLLEGASFILSNWEDTKLITYLATNSCAGNKLGLKDQSQEFAGNYAETEIKDIRRIPLDSLLTYNLVDTLSTWFVYEKHYSTMVRDQQLEIYTELFKPAILDIIQMQLTGLPVNMAQVAKARIALQQDEDDATNQMRSLPLVRQFEADRLASYTAKCNSEWVKKRMTEEEMLEASLTNEGVRKAISFNPNSDNQLRHLLYSQLGLPEIDFTDSKLPSTGGDTLKKLLNHTQDEEVLIFLKALRAYKEVNIILTIFIPAFEKAVKGPDGWHYLFGNFNLGGTVSGRLSSNNPNLQNIPATGSKYAKIIKECISAPKGKLLVGLDFASLEDRISALTTKDPNKIKVYTEGYDGHSLRAFFYYKEQMAEIVDKIEEIQQGGKVYKVIKEGEVEYVHESKMVHGTNYPFEEIEPIKAEVELINSIAKRFETFRQESKAPTFALTYQGTHHTLMANCGFSKEKAKMIETRYHEMYEVSDKWVQLKLKEAETNGYIIAAFGLRVRTPLIHQVILGNKKTPTEAAAEGRTAGNALGQSWCLLNSRAGSEFLGKVRNSEYRLRIRPSAQIHDAQYYIIDDDLPVLLFLNEHLVKASEWQDHPDIQHPEVGLGGEAGIFFPNWAHEMTIPNGASAETIRSLVQKHIAKLKEKGVL